MTGPVHPVRDDQSVVLRRFAALSGHFDPEQALGVVPDLDTDDSDAVVALAADLASVCDTRAGRASGSWLMRGPDRRSVLDSLSAELGEMVDWRRRAGPLHTETRDLLDALQGTGGFDVASLNELIAGGAREEMERAAVALDRAGQLAPATELLGTLRAAMTRQDSRARGAGLLADGFVGRAAELAEIATWLGTPRSVPPVAALFVSGLPGIGKSTLLEQAVRRATERPWVVVRLDFDRAGLEVRDWIGLTVELARQVAAELGEPANDLRQARLEALAGTASGPAVKGEAREEVPTLLAGQVADHLRRAGRPLLVLLDTLEVLRGRGESHPERLFRWLDQLVGTHAIPLSVIAAGRGDALDRAPGRVGRRLALERLEPTSVEALMSRLDVPAASAVAVQDIADGNPLVLRLAAAVVQDTGAAELRRMVRRRELAVAYLYRFLLSRIDQPVLKDLAFPGLVVRRINAEVIAEVLGPQLRRRIEPAQAVSMFEELARQHWLVQPDPQAQGFVTHRADVRQVLLRLLYDSRPAQCARIDRAAADWFARRPEPWSDVEAAYHRLQLMRRDPAVPALDPGDLRRFDEQTIAELPPAAQDVVRRVRGERTSLARGDRAAGAADLDAVTGELEAIVGSGDWIEGRLLYARVLRDAVFDARSRTADVVRALLWRCGDWSAARRLLDERDRRQPDDADLATLPPVLAAPRTEMRAELAARQLVRSMTTDPGLAGLVAGSAGHGLRAELSDGALGFVLHRAGVARPVSTARGYDSVGAAAGLRAPEPDRDAATAELGVAAFRLARRVSEPLPRWDDGAVTGPLGARLLAVLTPYVEVAVTLSRVRDDPAIGGHAEAVAERLGEFGGLPPRRTGPWTVLPRSGETIDGLAALGLLAEWLGAAAFVLHHPDLTLIARSAERWRRTAAGLWSFGSAPPEWRGPSGPLDLTMADRVAQLLDAADPIAESRRQLAVFAGADSGDGDPDPLLAELGRRLRGSLDRARAAAFDGVPEDVPDGAPDAAGVLLRYHVPSAFVPALAVLIAHRQL
ncbi:MAG TPA: AAA family ATPase [Pseudonocardia sp.]|nr:AAA family ATPase [Pseudonocardia sp.]